jgi:YidC/Oxa1 family membrane protein insertase
MNFLTAFFYNLIVAISAAIPGHVVWIAIAIITIILRLIFLPSSIKMIHVQKKQSNLQGKINEIKEKHKGNKQAEQQATLDLYKQEGVNPLSSCLPMIVQLVVLIFFYQIFRTPDLGVIKSQFLYSFTPHIGSLNTSFFGLDLALTVKQLTQTGGIGAILAYGFPLVAAGTQLIQALQTRALQPKTTDEGQSFQRAMNNQFVFLFPIMTAWISYTLTAALSIYWIIQTVFMIAQQKYVMSKMEPQILACEPVKPGQLPPKISKKGDVVVEVRQKRE